MEKKLKGFGIRSINLVFICVLAFCGIGTRIAHAQDTLPPCAAGTFYPDNPAELSVMIDNMLSMAAPAAQPGEIFALISPHAGYGYSGPTAAFGYKLIKAKAYKTVVIIGTGHNYGFSGVSVYPSGKFKTPLQETQIDADFAAQLLGRDPGIGFIPEAFVKEHSVEVQLPFLQKSLSDFKIVPIVMGDCTLDLCKKLAQLLKNAIGTRTDVLVVASTDMYHGYSLAEVEIIDRMTISSLKNMDAEGLYYGIREAKMQLCGGFGVVTTLILSKELGHKKLAVLNYTNSAIATGRKTDGEWTVGYVSCAIVSPEAEVFDKGGEAAMLNKEQRKKLLEIARKSIETYLATGKKMDVRVSDPLLAGEMGGFVTLNESGQLRGCIGKIIGDGPLYLTVRDMAVEAATGDPRFVPVQKAELKTIEIEISVLSPLKKVASADDIILGKHGVIVKKGINSGVFLPQVAAETRWSKEDFLSNLCLHKAGLPAGAWKDKTTELYVFTAEVFSEDHL